MSVLYKRAEAITLNDAIYYDVNRLGGGNPPYSMWGIKSYTKERCPKIDQFKPNQVLTYKDWVTLISGRAGTSFWHENTSWDAGCFEAEPFKLYPGYTRVNGWAKTFGPYKGYNGRPISECKLLDENFFWHAKFKKEWAGGTACTVINESLIFNLMYMTTPNINGWDGNGTYGVRFYPNYRSIYESKQLVDQPWWEPGCYAVYMPMQSTDGTWVTTSINVQTNDNGNIQGFKIAEGATTHKWNMVNCIFFVDVPCKFYGGWNEHGQGWTVNKGWNMQVMRITPPGYWKLE